MFCFLILSSSVEGDLDSLYQQISYLEAYGIDVTLLVDPSEQELIQVLKTNRFDCAYIHVKRRFVLHTEAYYDPAKLIEQKNVPLLGSSYITQILIADKYTTSKKSGMGLPNIIVSRMEFAVNSDSFGPLPDYPLIVKPNTLHASMGITEKSIVYNTEQLSAAIALLFEVFPFLNEVLVEKYVENAQEYTVSVLGNNDALACSVSKLEYKETATLRLNAKDQKELALANRSYVFACERDLKIRQRLEYHAKTLFRHFGMKDIARFDFILDKSYYLLEANTCPIPGNSFSWEWQEKYGIEKSQIIALFLCAFHFGQIASGRPSRLPLSLIDSLPENLIEQFDHPGAVDTCPECSGPTNNCSRPHLYSMNDRVSSETEVRAFLESLVALVKPKYILETGTYKGSSTIAFAEGLRKNGFGHMTTLEVDSNLARSAQLLFSEYPVEVLNQHSLSYIPKERIDLLFLDSKRDIRSDEFDLFHPFLTENAVIVWHDSSYREQNHSVYDAVEKLYERGVIDRILFPTPRGITLSMLRKQ